MKLALINVLLFVVGIFAPCMKVTPHLGADGGWDFVGEILFGGDFEPIVLSIADTLQKLFSSGSYFIGIVILVFTVLFPLYKMFLIFDHYYSGDQCSKRVGTIMKLSKLSMLDIFVIGLMLLSIKALPGGSTAVIQLGSIFFFINIFMTKFLLSKIQKEITLQNQ